MIPRIDPFWRNAVLVTAAHLAVLIGIARWTSGDRKPDLTKDVVWLKSAASPALAQLAPTNDAPEEVRTPPPSPPPETPAIQLPTATPEPTATPTPTPTPRPAATPTPTPTPKPTSTPKSTPKRTPKSTPKPKATPRKTAKTTPTPKRKTTPRSSATPTSTPKTTASPDESSDESTAEAPAKPTTGLGSSAGSKSQLALYRGMLHDRFYGAWNQPTTSVPAGASFSAIARVRIEKDGRVSSFRIVRSSGNVIVDESVAAIAGRVSRVDTPPAGIVPTPYEVNIRFELNPD